MIRPRCDGGRGANFDVDIATSQTALSQSGELSVIYASIRMNDALNAKRRSLWPI